MPADEELIDEILSGSQAAMEVLIKRYYKNIFSYVYRNLGDYHAAYDITQDIFIKMMKSLSTYREKGSFKNWIFKIAVNACIDYCRSRSYKTRKSQIALSEEFSDGRDNVWDLFSRDFEREKVKSAVLSLPDYQRNALILKYYHDMRIKDIALLTGSNEATVKSRLRQGIEKLRRMLCGGDIDEETGNES